MRVSQELSSGIVIRQDFSESIRIPLFETNEPEYPYATHGGTIFLVKFESSVYAVTCRHVFGDFKKSELILTDRKYGRRIVRPKMVASPSLPTGDAEDSDIVDLAVLRFHEGDAYTFGDTPYILDRKTWDSSDAGDDLLVAGSLKEYVNTISDPMEPGFCILEFIDLGPLNNEPVLRSARARYERPKFSSLTGISGSPVFNKSKSRLCGMVVRGNINQDNTENIKYIDASDIIQLLSAIKSGSTEISYSKTVKTPHRR